jgi:hypothetical protein
MTTVNSDRRKSLLFLKTVAQRKTFSVRRFQDALSHLLAFGMGSRHAVCAAPICTANRCARPMVAILSALRPGLRDPTAY